MKTRCSRLSIVCSLATCALVSITASDAAVADMTPSTTVNVDAQVNGSGISHFQSVTTPNGPSSASASTGSEGANGTGSNAGAASAAFADFGTLGVSGSGSAVAPPGSHDAAAAPVQAFASWDDFLTAFPTKGQPIGTPVTANLLLDLSFTNALLNLGVASGTFDYELSAALATIDPVTGARLVSILFDDCFVVSEDFNLCDVGSHLTGIPGNTGNQHLTVELAPIPLAVSILEPFELAVSLAFAGQCSAVGVSPVDSTQISSCGFDGDALHTSLAFLQPQGDFTLVAASGHDYSQSTPNGAPEPASLPLIVAGFLAAALWLKRQNPLSP